jgi:glycosyltransferase involved in cell wall biosynthesis
MAFLEIFEVVSEPHSSEGLRGGSIDRPRQGRLVEARALSVEGWVLGRDTRVVAVEVIHAGEVVRRVPVELMRDDVLEAYPEATRGLACGFRTTLGTLPLADLELEVRAVLRDQRRARLGRIRARARWREIEGAGQSTLVSVVIPCYGQAHYLPQAVESVMAQSYPHLEVVVVDDGSADNTEEVCRRYPGVRCVRQENRGLAGARNTGIRRSNGPYLVFLDADDRLLPRALETGLERLEAEPRCAASAGHHRIIGPDGKVLDEPSPPEVGEDVYATLLRRCFITAPASVLYRRSVFEQVEPFDSRIDAGADYDLYLRIASRFPICCHSTVVAEYRRHAGSMSQHPEVMGRAILAALGAQRRQAGERVETRKAFREGMRSFRRHYGRLLAQKAVRRLSRGEWVGGLSAMVDWIRLSRGQMLPSIRSGAGESP